MSDNTNSGGQQKPTLSWSQPAPKANGDAKPTAAHPAKQEVPASGGMGTYVGIFAAGLIIGALIGWAITSNKSGSSTTTSTSASATSTIDTSGMSNGSSTDTSGASMGSGSAVVLAQDQQAGFAVAVDKVSVAQPTWLVVYEDHNGTPGNAIGAGLFFAGQTSGTVELLRATLPGQSYFVGQSLDDGDKVFSLQGDKPVRDAEGNPLFTEFTAK